MRLGVAGALVALLLACAVHPVGAHQTGEAVEGDLRWLEEQAAAGDPEAWYRIGVIKERGIGMVPDPLGALEAYRAAAELGHPQAQLRLAQLLAAGLAGAADFAEARRWYAAAAEQGLPQAAYNLGLMAERGVGGPLDLPLAVEAYRQAVGGGIAEAAVQLALLHLGEALGEPDEITALAWLYKAELLGAAGAGELAAELSSKLTAAEQAEAFALSRTL